MEAGQTERSGSDSDSSAPRQVRDENRQRCTVVASVGGVLVMLAALAYQAQEMKRSEAALAYQAQEMKRSDCPTFVDGLAKRIEQKYVFEFPKGPIIQRRELNATLAITFDRAELTVVLGQRQAGKSVLVQSWLNGKKNVYHYSPKDAEELGEDDEKACGNEFLRKGTLIRALRKVRKTPEEPAIVAFEINHNTENRAITGIYESLKNIVFDSQLPHTKGLLVLSNSYAIEAFPADHGRYETVWVGHLTEDEAKEFIKVKRKGDADQYIKGLNATGLHLRLLETAVGKKSLAAWKARVLEEVRLAAQVPDTRNVMRRLPKAGAKWHQLNISRNGLDVIELVRHDTTRVVVYSAGPRWFHWASPQHHQAWSEVVAHEHPAEKDEL